MATTSFLPLRQRDVQKGTDGESKCGDDFPSVPLSFIITIPRLLSRQHRNLPLFPVSLPAPRRPTSRRLRTSATNYRYAEGYLLPLFTPRGHYSEVIYTWPKLTLSLFLSLHTSRRSSALAQRRCHGQGNVLCPINIPAHALCSLVKQFGEIIIDYVW